MEVVTDACDDDSWSHQSSHLKTQCLKETETLQLKSSGETMYFMRSIKYVVPLMKSPHSQLKFFPCKTVPITFG